ncbi:hypothetical protein DFI02_12033 [Rhizobium sp. PP-F2F-G20b]|nr:hypothetical protein DFI02_12033 [Rhizobium sp. PP-F2F-G20b]
MEGKGISNLLREGECTLNFPSSDLWSNVERIAPTTGLSLVSEGKARNGYVHVGDKFALGAFTGIGSELVRTPRIAECPLQMEAQLLASHRSAPDHTNTEPPHLIVEVGVLKIHAHSDMVLPGTNHIDTAKWNPLFYVFRHYFGNAVDLGKSFRAES